MLFGMKSLSRPVGFRASGTILFAILLRVAPRTKSAAAAVQRFMQNIDLLSKQPPPLLIVRPWFHCLLLSPSSLADTFSHWILLRPDLRLPPQLDDPRQDLNIGRRSSQEHHPVWRSQVHRAVDSAQLWFLVKQHLLFEDSPLNLRHGKKRI